MLFFIFKNPVKCYGYFEGELNLAQDQNSGTPMALVNLPTSGPC